MIQPDHRGTFLVLYMFGFDSCYLEWHHICSASESASDVKSCELYASIDRQWSIKDTVYHVGVTSVCRRPKPKGLPL